MCLSVSEHVSGHLLHHEKVRRRAAGSPTEAVSLLHQHRLLAAATESVSHDEATDECIRPSGPKNLWLKCVGTQRGEL